MTPDALPKPRPDAKLKTLPEVRQVQIADFARTHSLNQTVQWLSQAGLKTSISAVSQFLRWYRFKQDLARNEAALRDSLVDVLRHDPASNGERLQNAGHLLFTLSAIEKQDHRAWYLTQTVAIRKNQQTIRHRPQPEPPEPNRTQSNPKKIIAAKKIG